MFKIKVQFNSNLTKDTLTKINKQKNVTNIKFVN